MEAGCVRKIQKEQAGGITMLDGTVSLCVVAHSSRRGVEYAEAETAVWNGESPLGARQQIAAWEMGILWRIEGTDSGR